MNQIREEEEEHRLRTLQEYELLDSEQEHELDDIARLAAAVCNTPIALISLLDKKRQWFKSKIGLEVPETEREIAFCNYTIAQESVLEVNDAQEDARFAKNPLVTGFPNIKFYTGAPLIAENGYKLGSLCVIDHVPKVLTTQQKEALTILARQVMSNFELRKSRIELRKEKKDLEEKVQLSSLELLHANHELDRFVYSASHELRAPLKSILGLVGLAMIDHSCDTAALREMYISRMDGSIRRLDKLISDIIDYSRNSRLEIKCDKLKIYDIISEILRDLQFLEIHQIEKKFSLIRTLK